MTFAENLRSLHETYGTPYSFIAGRSGLSTSLVSAYAKGRCQPTIDKAIKIIKASPANWGWHFDGIDIWRDPNAER